MDRTLLGMGPAQPTDAPDNGDARFSAIWADSAGRVLAYALRHSDSDTAQEVVSETFLVAWRRLDEVPSDPLPWLLVVASNTLKNMRRSDLRRDRLHVEIDRTTRLAGPAPGPDETVAERAGLLAALAALTPTEREALLLTAWDGLTPAEAARVAGCSTATFHVRLFRARRHLDAYDTPSESVSHDPAPPYLTNGSPA